MTDPHTIDPKQHLSRYLISQNLIRRLLDDIEQRVTIINAVCKPLRSADIQRAAGGNSAEDRLVSLVDFKAKKYMAIYLNAIICIQVERSIYAMPPGIHRTILYERYVHGKSFHAISRETGLYCMKIIRLHGEALNIYGGRFATESHVTESHATEPDRYALY